MLGQAVATHLNCSQLNFPINNFHHKPPMDLKILIKSCELKRIVNSYVVVQMDELKFPEKKKRVEKQRTDIIVESSGPKFKNNLFHFENLNLGSRITVKFGCFRTTKIADDNADIDLLVSSSTVFGIAVLTLTQRIITHLRENPSFEESLKLMDINHDQEMGRIDIAFKFDHRDISTKVTEDKRMAERYYYDLFEEDNTKIAEASAKIEEICLTKQTEFESIVKKLEYIRSADRVVQVDLARLKEEKERLETENQDMRSRLDKLRNYKELDIQIDMLGDSPQGNEILRKKYATLLNKISFERSVYNELTEHYFQIQDKLGYKEKVSKSLKELKQARETQAFHLQRHEDQMPQLLGLRETVRSQESIISNLEYSIKEELQRKDKSKMTQVDVNYQRLKNERNLLKEKDLQLQMLLGMNDGRLTREMVAQLKTEKYFQTDTAELRKLKATAND